MRPRFFEPEHCCCQPRRMEPPVCHYRQPKPVIRFSEPPRYHRPAPKPVCRSHYDNKSFNTLMAVGVTATVVGGLISVFNR